jgi:hydroxyacyl-ACP dehydratase HTD2-like protein with hotdog domain
MTIHEMHVGDVLAEQDHTPTEVQLFRYSAATNNTHRIHYDQDYARTERYPTVLVQSHLHGALLTRLCTDWLRGRGYIESLSVTVRHFAVPGDTLTCRAVITSIETAVARGGQRLRLSLEEVRKADDTVCASGEAEIVLAGDSEYARVPVSTAPVAHAVASGDETASTEEEAS